MSTATLSKYLQKLEDEGLIFRDIDRDKRPTRVVYKINLGKVDIIEKYIRQYIEYIKKRVEELYIVLTELDFKEAEKLFDELKKKLGK